METNLLYLRFGFDYLNRICLKIGCTSHMDSRTQSYKSNGNYGPILSILPVKNKIDEILVQFYFRNYKIDSCGREVFEPSDDIIKNFSELDIKTVCIDVWKNRDTFIGDIRSLKRNTLKERAILRIFEVLFDLDLEKLRANLTTTMLDYKILNSVLLGK